jgi:FtsZ-binding cell division protein ZapB
MAPSKGGLPRNSIGNPSVHTNLSVFFNNLELVSPLIRFNTVSTIGSFLAFFSELLAKTSTAVFESLEEKRKQVQANIDGFKAMQLPIEELLAVSKKQSEIFDEIIATIQTSADTQIKMWNSVQAIQGKINGH